MPMLDVFRGDAYGVVSLTAAVNKLPYVPARLGQLGLFRKKGVTTSTVMVEEQRGKLYLIQSAARGTAPNVYGGTRRQARSFVVPALPIIGNVFADDVQNVRAFGEESAVDTVANVVNQKLMTMRQSIEATIEFHRIGALKGILLDADLTTIYDWGQEFLGASVTTKTFAFAAGTNPIMPFCNDIRRSTQDALGADTYTGIRVLCSKSFYDAVSGSTEVRTAYQRIQDGQFLVDSHARASFEYGGLIFEEYRGTVGTTPYIVDGEAYSFPEGTTDIFIESYSPAPFVETVNTMGRPVYAKQRPMDWDVGIELNVQSHPLCINTRPGVVFKCGFTGTPAFRDENPSLFEYEKENKKTLTPDHPEHPDHPDNPAKGDKSKLPKDHPLHPEHPSQGDLSKLPKDHHLHPEHPKNKDKHDKK